MPTIPERLAVSPGGWLQAVPSTQRPGTDPQGIWILTL